MVGLGSDGEVQSHIVPAVLLLSKLTSEDSRIERNTGNGITCISFCLFFDRSLTCTHIFCVPE